MRIIKSKPGESGAYPPIMDGWDWDIPDGWLPVAEDCDTAAFAATQGFVALTVKSGVVTAMTANEPAYQAYLAGLTPAIEDLRTAKLAELNAACDAAIATGCDVTLSDGTAGHISLTIADQINLSTAQGAVASGAAGYAYHLDGALCEIYPAADIAIMASAATAHVLYHQTYCNHARQWAKRCATEAELEAVTYGAALPDDLAEHMAAVLAAAKEGADA